MAAGRHTTTTAYRRPVPRPGDGGQQTGGLGGLAQADLVGDEALPRM
jgi:hypothetical protein